MKPGNRELAIKLRKSGMLYSEIADELKIPKSTAYSWLCKIPLSDDEKQQINEVLLHSKQKAIPRLNSLRKKKYSEEEKSIQKNAKLILNQYENQTPNNIVALSMLFWSEGEKDLSGGVRFINSDPEMIKLYLGLFRNSFNLEESKFKVQLHVHEYHDTASEIKYWSDLTRIPISSFYKPYLKINTGKRKREDYHGTVSIRYSDHRLGKLLKMVYTDFGKSIGV